MEMHWLNFAKISYWVRYQSWKKSFHIRATFLHWNLRIKSLILTLLCMKTFRDWSCIYNNLSSLIRIMLFAFLFQVFEQDFVPELLARPDNNGVNDLLYDDSTEVVTHPLWGSNHETNEFIWKIHEKSNDRLRLCKFKIYSLNMSLHSLHVCTLKMRLHEKLCP